MNAITPMTALTRRLPALLALLLLPAGASAQDPFPRDPFPPFVVGPDVQVTPLSGHTPPQAAPPRPTAADLADLERCLEERYQERVRRFRLPVDPFAAPSRVNSPPTDPAGVPDAPGDFRVFRNTVMNDTFTNNSTSSTNEPTLGMNGRVVLYAGNWYASVSGDHGQAFTFVNPATAFANPTSGGFCCDQVVYYEPTRNLMCWYLQYTGNNNPGRLVVYRSQEDIVANNWLIYDLPPSVFGYSATNTGFDFPDLSASAHNLYITTNITGAGATDQAIVMRLSLDTLAAGGAVTVNNFRSPALPNLRCTHGAGTTMFVGTQVNTSTLRIFSWGEGAGAPTSADRTVNTFFNVTSSAPSPDGTNWVGRDFHDILAAATGNGTAVFMWGSAQGGGFTWPNVRYARFTTAGMTLADQGTVFSSNTAWAYPAVHTNGRGHFGGVIAFGGGPAVSPPFPFPSVAAFIADDFNSTTFAPLENALIATGTNGPTSNRWGDYYTARRGSPYAFTWVAAAHVLNGGGGNAAAEPRFAWFGRERDQPPPSHTIYVDKANTTNWQDGSAAHPYRTAARGFFAAVNNDTIIVRGAASPYLENFVWNKILTVRNEAGAPAIGGF